MNWPRKLECSYIGQNRDWSMFEKIAQHQNWANCFAIIRLIISFYSQCLGPSAVTTKPSTKQPRTHYSTMHFHLLCFLFLFVGIHALINVHEYNCIAIRMRCWLVDVFFLYSLLQCWQYMCCAVAYFSRHALLLRFHEWFPLFRIHWISMTTHIQNVDQSSIWPTLRRNSIATVWVAFAYK